MLMMVADLNNGGVAVGQNFVLDISSWPSALGVVTREATRVSQLGLLVTRE